MTATGKLSVYFWIGTWYILCFCQAKNILIATKRDLVTPALKFRPDIQWPDYDCKIPFNNNFLCFYKTTVKVKDNENLIW